MLGSRGGLAPNFASEILVGAPNFASKNINDKYPKFCPLNFRYDPKIGTFSQLLRLVVTELPKFSLLFGELDRTLPPNFASKLDVSSKPPLTSLFGSTPLGSTLICPIRSIFWKAENIQAIDSYDDSECNSRMPGEGSYRLYLDPG